MKKLLIFLSILALLSGCTSVSEWTGTCASLTHCIDELYRHSKTDDAKQSSLSLKEQELIDQFDKFGDNAVDALVPLLERPDDALAGLASAALRGMSSIDEKHLPKILEALDGDKNLGWLPPALGRIDSPIAAEEAVKRFIGSKSAPHNQEAFAIKLLGARAIPFIVDAAQCGHNCSYDIHNNLGHVLGDMDDSDKRQAARDLIHVIQSKQLFYDESFGMILMIAELRESAKVIENDLLTLRNNNKDLWDVINHALVEMKSDESGDILSHHLSVDPNLPTLWTLSRTGNAGVSAGPIVLKMLDSPDWELRSAAVDALGSIGYTEAIPALVEMLQKPGDVNLNWSAANALATIGAKKEIDTLQEIANKHWFPPVRDAARDAIKRLRGEDTIEGKNRALLSLIRFYGTETCKTSTVGRVEENTESKIYDRERLLDFKYESEIVSYRPNDEKEQKAKNPNGIIEINESNITEYRETINQVPDMALKIPSGWLVGADRGEWGGELVHVNSKGERTVLLQDNVEDIYLLGDRYIAVTGLAHLASSRGLVYELIELDSYSRHAKPWRALPGAPESSWLAESGEIAIETYGSGSVMISEDGTMRMMPCSNE